MPVKIISRLYANQFYQPANQTDWLLGNAGDWQNLKLQFEAEIAFFASSSETIAIDVPNQTLTLNNQKTWASYGFDIGDTVKMRFTRSTTDPATGNRVETPFLANLVIQNLYGSVMEHDNTFNNAEFLNGIGIIPTDRGTLAVYDISFISAKEPEGIKFRYNLITNDDFDQSFLSSFLDQSVTEFSYAGLDSLPIGVEADLNPDGFQSGMAISGGTIKKISIVDSVYTYEVSINFMINSLFEDPTNFELPLTPPSQLFNAGSLTDNFEIVLFPEWNNPNTKIQNDLRQTARLGNTGWFDENFNGLDNNFVVESVAYFDDDGLPLTAIDYVNPSNVEVRISGINNLTPASEFGFGFAWVPQDENEYFNKNTPYQDNLFINTGREYTNGINDSFNLDEINTGQTYPGNGLNGAAMDVQPSSTSLFSGAGLNEVLFKARFVPNAAFASVFGAKEETDRNYVLWVSVADQNLQINFSDRVSLFVDYQGMVENIPIAGPYPGMSNRFIEHPQAFNVEGVEKYFGFLNDDILNRVLFKVDKSSGDFITAMTFGFDVVNTETGAAYALQSVPVNLSGFQLDPNGIQDINYDAIRGFKLEAGNNKNWVKVLRNPPEDTATEAGFIAYFAAKLRWEDWIPRDNVAAEYFNTALPNNGQNNDWLDYLRSGALNSHDFFFTVITTVLGADGNTLNYKNSFELTFNGYDENLNIVTEHNYYRDSDNTLLNIGTDPETGKPLGIILNDEPTRIEILYEDLTEDFDFDFMYAVMTLEVDLGGGQFEMRQLSSFWGSEPSNPLYPIAGETRLLFELTGPRNIRTAALVDPSKLIEASRYRITGRIGCWKESPGLPVVPGIYAPTYESTYE